MRQKGFPAVITTDGFNDISVTSNVQDEILSLTIIVELYQLLSPDMIITLNIFIKQLVIRRFLFYFQDLLFDPYHRFRFLLIIV